MRRAAAINTASSMPQGCGLHVPIGLRESLDLRGIALGHAPTSPSRMPSTAHCPATHLDGIPRVPTVPPRQIREALSEQVPRPDDTDGRSIFGTSQLNYRCPTFGLQDMNSWFPGFKVLCFRTLSSAPFPDGPGARRGVPQDELNAAQPPHPAEVRRDPPAAAGAGRRPDPLERHGGGAGRAGEHPGHLHHHPRRAGARAAEGARHVGGVRRQPQLRPSERHRAAAVGGSGSGPLPGQDWRGQCGRYSERVRAALARVRQRLAGLDAHRQAIDARRLGLADSLGWYSDTIETLIRVEDVAAGEVDNRSVAGVLAAGRLGPSDAQRLAAISALQSSWLDRFQAAATPAQRAVYSKTVTGPD